MVAFRACVFAALALSSSVLAAFEPLDAQDLFARSPAAFEPLDSVPSVTRRSGVVPGQYLPKAHGLVSRGVSAAVAIDVNTQLKSAKEQLTPIASQVSSICSGASKGTSPTKIIGQLTPHLSKCKKVISDCSGGVGSAPHKPHPSSGSSSGGGNPGSGGCSSSLKELIELVEELIGEVKDLTGEISELEDFLSDYVDSLDGSLSDLVTSTDSAVSGVASHLKEATTSTLKTSLHTVGFHGLVDVIVGA